MFTPKRVHQQEGLGSVFLPAGLSHCLPGAAAGGGSGVVAMVAVVGAV